MNNNTQNEASGFNGLGIAPRLLEILDKLGYENPTPIQSKSIPASLERKDMVGIAQTGTGKTLAFGIPMIQLLAVHKGRGLVVLPTRELAMQVDENLRVIGESIGLRTSVLIGGESINKQFKSLKAKPHIIIATPGRLLDHVERATVDLSQVNILVLDEADMMLDMGFLPQVKSILKLVSPKRQTMLFSATMPSQIVKIASDFMTRPTRIEVAPAGTSAENVEQEIIVVEKSYKIDYLQDILSKSRGSVLIFMRTKHTVKSLTKKLNKLGFSSAEIHSNRSLGQRQEALEGFKMGKYRVLVATDIAARGIDVKDIELVINFDLPEKTGDYVHRIGRTARAGKSGKAISFVMPSQIRTLREIERLIKQTIKTNKTEEELNAIARTVPPEKRGGGGGARRNSSRRPRRPSPTHNKKATSQNLNENSKDWQKNNTTNRSDNKSQNTRVQKTSAEVGVTDRERFRRSMATRRR